MPVISASLVRFVPIERSVREALIAFELRLISESRHKVMFSICTLWRFILTIALGSVSERVR